MDATQRDALQGQRSILRCPTCRGRLSDGSDVSISCPSCRIEFPIISNASLTALSLLPQTVSATKQRSQTFWGDLYRQWHGEASSHHATPAQLAEDLDQLEQLFRRRRHLAVTEMPLGQVAGKRVCEIGSGAGAHSALFRKHGAYMTSVDITPERVLGTAHKLRLLESVVPGSGLAMQADAEKLPFADDTFDIVYSNGVLHHTENTEAAVAEVLRVLKPGGKAVLMLYSRHSALFWLKLLPKAFLTGALFRLEEPYWLGRITEGRPAFGSETNPITRVYSARQLRTLLAPFATVRLRKSSCQFGHFVFKGDQIRNRVLHALGVKPNPAGTLVYGSAFYPETGLEMWLGPRCGFAWNISARK